MSGRIIRSIPFGGSCTEDRGVKFLIAGFGYVGSALAAELVSDGHEVWGLRRRFTQAPEGVHTVEADLALPSDLGQLPGALDAVIYLASPGGSDDALYRAVYVEGTANLLAALEAAGERPRRIFFASSTAVYGQHAGEWVDEESPTEPTHFSGKRLLEAEGQLRDCASASSIVRFGGIYGPRRTGLVDRVRTGVVQYRRGRYTNRIHRDDCVGVLRHLLAHPSPASLYLGVDCEPVDEQTLYNWLSGATGAPAPREAETPRGASPPARGGNKRCCNDRLLASGYAFLYPTFRDGYAAVLAE
ncbi:MAG: NAD-dependent epimerase/dehydratase family protein [Deltaproteobacteria bacterium]|nr:NAD-dependent epimerase/dehydratase family protein [Deltaproteobacteria bacterium]